MRLATGVDLIEIERVEKAIERHGQRFLSRIFTLVELEECGGKLDSLAARFAAKEAVAKAFGTGLGKDIYFKDIEVQNMPSGQPMIKLSAKVQDLLIQKGSFDLKISLSGIKDFAVAFGIIFCNQTFKENQQSV